MTKESVEEALADLISHCEDSATALEKAVRRVKNLVLKEMLKEFGIERRHIVAALKNESRALTGTAAEGGTFAGGLQQFLGDLKAEVTGSEDREVLEDLAESEQRALEEFAEALEADLPPQTAGGIREQQARVAAAKARIDETAAVLKQEAEKEEKPEGEPEN